MIRTRDRTWTPLEECPARSKVLILDCCFSGAFAQGSKGTPIWIWSSGWRGMAGARRC